MARQRSKTGSVFGYKLNSSVPPDAVPLGDGRNLYSPSRREVINWEACIEDDMVTQSTAVVVPPGPPTP